MFILNEKLKLSFNYFWSKSMMLHQDLLALDVLKQVEEQVVHQIPAYLFRIGRRHVDMPYVQEPQFFLFDHKKVNSAITSHNVLQEWRFLAARRKLWSFQYQFEV